MNRRSEGFRAEIRSFVEREPFESPVVEQFFSKYCEINDSLEVRVVSRKEWEKRFPESILEKNPDGRQLLFIPSDIKLWEMMGIIEVVDRETFAFKPEKRLEAKEKILALGKVFKDAGIYLAKRLDGINQGKEMAKALALEFYEYGEALIRGKLPEKSPSLKDISQQELTLEDTQNIDSFFASEALSASRKEKAKVRASEKGLTQEQSLEKERQKALSQFFRVLQKAFILQEKSRKGDLKKVPLKAWQSGNSVHGAFLARIERELREKIEAPYDQLELAVFRRGLEKLVNEMAAPSWRLKLENFFKRFIFNVRREKKTLFQALKIDSLKTELKHLREKGDLKMVVAKERKIADKIQKAISKIPYQRGINHPSAMVALSRLNCVGASMLAGALMKEAGLNYLVGDLPSHSILFLITSDGNVEWRDMIYPQFNQRLTNEMIEGKREDGKPLTVDDIVSFSKNPKGRSLRFYLKNFKDGERIFSAGKRRADRGRYIIVFRGENGLRLQTLNNLGFSLLNSSKFKGQDKERYIIQAAKAYHRALSFDPKYTYAYNGLGTALSELCRYEKAIQYYRKAISVDPDYLSPYQNLGNVFMKLGRYQEAVEVYNRFLELADPEMDEQLIKEVKQERERAEKLLKQKKQN